MFKRNEKLYTSMKPVISFIRRYNSKRHWTCRLYSQKHGRMIVGQGTTPETAYNGYVRNLKWYDQGQPGKPKWSEPVREVKPSLSTNFVVPLSVKDSLDRLK